MARKYRMTVRDGRHAQTCILASMHDAMLDDARWPGVSALIDETCGLTGNDLTVREGPQDDVRILFVGAYAAGSAAKTRSATTSRTTIPPTNACRASGSRPAAARQHKDEDACLLCTGSLDVRVGGPACLGADGAGRTGPARDAIAGRATRAGRVGSADSAAVRRGGRRRRQPCPAAIGHRVDGADRRRPRRRRRPPGRLQSRRPVAGAAPVLPRQPAGGWRSGRRRPPREPAGPGPGPHAGARERQAAPPRGGHRLAGQWRGRRRAGTRHLDHPGDRAAADRGTCATGRRPSTGRTPSPGC